MRFDDFVDEIRAAGWKNLNDAQHTGIRKVWEKLFPVIAEMENEIEELKREICPSTTAY